MDTWEVIIEIGIQIIIIILGLSDSSSKSEIANLRSSRIASAAVEANMACFDCGRRGYFVAN